MPVTTVESTVAAAGFGSLQRTYHFLVALRQAGVAEADLFRAVAGAYQAEKARRVEAARLQTERFLETVYTDLPRCPDCGAVLFLRPIKIPPGPNNVHGYRSCWFCDHGDCTYERYNSKTVEDHIELIKLQKGKA